MLKCTGWLHERVGVDLDDEGGREGRWRVVVLDVFVGGMVDAEALESRMWTGGEEMNTKDRRQ